MSESKPPTEKLCEACQSNVPIKATKCKHCGEKLKTTKNEVETFSNFTVSKSVVTYADGSAYTTSSINIEDKELLKILKEFLSWKELYKEKCSLDPERFLDALPLFRERRENETLKSLNEYIESAFKEQTQAFDEMLARHVISFQGLKYIFAKGRKIVGRHHQGPMIGCEIMSSSIRESWTGLKFVINCEVLKTNGKKLFKDTHVFSIPEYDGVMDLQLLPVQLMDDKILAELTERGRKFYELSIGPHYKLYEGHMFFTTSWGIRTWKADGRCMLDTYAFNKINPGSGYDREKTNEDEDKDSEKARKKLEENFYKVWPTVGAFSLSTKRWGEALLDKVSQITFDDKAFDQLVLNQKKKDIMKSLVLNTQHSLKDIISGKGAGCIFLLHGPPGVGKTLTAEAIAEVLHVPLYSVSVGQLGTTPDILEKRLAEILEVGAGWKSVMLLDEADIFLERRTEHDIIRNAMVSIFLRLLEYHEGILFLTTNRVGSFDDAFYSRINVSLQYEELDRAARAKIWQNFLYSINCPYIKVDTLAEFDLNGREIRSTIRLAQALAKGENTALTIDHIIETIGLTSVFKNSHKRNVIN